MSQWSLIPNPSHSLNEELMSAGQEPLTDAFVTATGLQPSTQYRFRVRARNAYGLSAVSAVSEAFKTGTYIGYCGIPTRPRIQQQLSTSTGYAAVPLSCDKTYHLLPPYTHTYQHFLVRDVAHNGKSEICRNHVRITWWTPPFSLNY